MPDRADYLRLFEEHLDEDFEVLFAPAPPPSREAIEAFGRAIGCALPDDYVSLLASDLGGFYAEAKETAWPRKRGGRFWMFQHALLTYGLDAGLPDWIDLRAQVAQFRQDTGTLLTPCMRTIGSADPHCFDPEGRLVRWDHESGRAAPENETFFATLDHELRALRSNKDRMKAAKPHT